MFNLTSVTGFLFDVDGTLVDSNDQHAKAFEKAFHEKGHAVSFDKIRWLVGMGGEKLIPAALERECSDEEIKEIGDLKSRYFKEEFFGQIKAFPQVRELISSLKDRGYELAVASSASKEELHSLLQVAQVEDLFSVVASADDAGRSKPSPDILIAAVRKLGVRAKELVMVGDTPYDLHAAGGAGMSSVAFRSGGWADRDLDEAMAIFDGAADLFAKLS